MMMIKKKQIFSYDSFLSIFFFFFFILSIIIYTQCSSSSSTLITPQEKNVNYKNIFITKLTRDINLQSFITREEVQITIENKGSESVSFFDYFIDNRLQGYRFSKLEASYLLFNKETSKMEKLKLVLDDAIVIPSSLTTSTTNKDFSKDQPDQIIRIYLPNPLEKGQIFSFNLDVILASPVYPYPKKVNQGSEHTYRFFFTTVFYSPYSVKEQTYNIRVPVNSVKFYTKFEKTESSERNILYRTTTETSPFSFKEALVEYVKNDPNIVINQLERKLTLSHWHGSVQVEEFYDITNNSPGLLKPFSRMSYGHSAFQPGKVPPLKSLTLQLPKKARFITYRDEVGNISTSRCNVEKDYTKLEIQPRFPLFGEWKSSFVVSYNIPVSQAVSTVTDEIGHHKQFMMPLYTLFGDVWIEKFILKVIFPEGTKLVTFTKPFGRNSTLKVETIYSYLDTNGRPQVTIEADTLVKEHMMDYKIFYDYGTWSMLRKLFLVIFVYFGLFLGLILYKRSNFVVSPDMKKVIKPLLTKGESGN